jgi:hypothetical protein
MHDGVGARDVDEREILELIRECFPPHPLRPEQAFDEWGGTYLQSKEFKQESKGIPWDELSFKFLRFHYDALAYLGPSSYVEYLPAFLTAMVARRRDADVIPLVVLATLRRRPNDQEANTRLEKRLGALTDQQKRAVAEVLAYLECTRSEGSWRNE